MKKVNLFKKMLMLAFISLSTQINAQELQMNQLLSPNQAVAIAQKGLPDMLQLIEPEDLKEYGFTKSENFSNVEIGRPFYVVTLPRTASSSHTETIAVNPYTIMLPVILDGKARCILYVSQEEGTWKVVGIGEGNFVATQQSVFTTTTDEDGSSNIIVSIPHLSQQYLMTANRAASFQPLIQFEDTSMESISMATLVELNNTIPVEVNENLNDNQLNNSK